MTIEEVKIGDRVEWFLPRETGTVIDVNYSSIKIRWDAGEFSIHTKSEGFSGWKVLEL